MNDNGETEIDTYETPQAPEHTITVHELMMQLQGLDPNAPVLFRSPHFGCFGSNQAYGITGAQAVTMERREHINPAGVGFDEETGNELTYEASKQVWPAWSGVVIGAQP